MSVTVHGADRLARTLNDAARKVKAMAAANRDVAAGIRNAAHPPVRSGRLASSLTATGTDTEATVSSGLVYAPVIEHGWARHNIEATNFLAQAETARRAETTKRYSDHCGDSIAGVKGA